MHWQCWGLEKKKSVNTNAPTVRELECVCGNTNPTASMTENERGDVSGQDSCHQALKRCFLKVIFQEE